MMRLFFLGLTALLALTGCATQPASPPPATAKVQETPLVQRTLNELVTAYQNKDMAQFSSHVSERYFGDKTRLQIRVSRDFRALDDIIVHPAITRLHEDGRGRAFVEATYNRSHTDIATGRRVTLSGQVSLVFEAEEGRYRLISQRPTLFGIR